MADTERLKQALIAADRAGDVQAARTLAAALRQAQPDAIDQSAMDAMMPSPTERMGRGMMDLYQGIKQLGLKVKDAATGSEDEKAYTKQADEDIARYERGRGPDAGIDWMRLAGNVATPASLIPGVPAASVPARFGIAAATGALQGGASYVPEDGSRAVQTALGTFGGVVGGGVAEGAGRAVRAGVNAIGNNAQQRFINTAAANIVNDPGQLTIRLRQVTNDAGINWNTLTQEVQQGLRAEATRQLQAGGALNPEALARIARAQSLDPRLQLTRGQATRTPQDWQTEQNLRSVQGVGDPLRERFGQQGQVLTENAQRLNRETDPYNAADQTIRTLRQKFNETGDEVSNLYTVARESMGLQANVPLGPLQRVGMEVLDRFEGNIPASVERKLREFGITRMGPVQPTRALTVESAEDLVKTINANWNAADRTKTAALSQLRGALGQSLDDLGNAGTEAAQGFAQARKAASGRFDEMGQRIAGAAADDVAPDRFVRRFVLNADARDIQALTRSLTTGTPEQIARGAEALTALRQGAITELFERNNVMRDGMFSGSNLDRALRSLGPQRMAAIFTPEQVQQLNLLRQVSLDLTRPPAMADVNYSRTTAALANLFQSIGNLPVVGKITQGAGGKVIDMIIAGEQRGALQRAMSGTAATAPAPVETMTREGGNALVRRIAPYTVAPTTNALLSSRR